MKQDKNIYDRLERIIEKCNFGGRRKADVSLTDVADYLYEQYSFPYSKSMDFFNGLQSIYEATEFEAFIMLDGFITILKTKDNIEDYYTESEMDKYYDSKFENKNKIKFPLKFKMVKVLDNQYIGVINTKTLMTFRANNLINYNTNAQRIMTRVIKGEKEYYKISVNKSAVTEISDAKKNGVFIPNTITLNVPIDEDLEYDDSTCELIIKSIDHFDITDGYHRYLADCINSDNDPNYDSIMELRIVHWDEAKANQFIFQEDQKTKMVKADSDYLNAYKPSNIVCNRLNEDPMFNYNGSINRYDGLIPFQALSECISYFYFNKTKKQDEKRLIIEATKEIKNNFNNITECHTELLNKKYNKYEILALMVLFNEVEDIEVRNKIVIKYLDKVNNEKFKGSSVIVTTYNKNLLCDFIKELTN